MQFKHNNCQNCPHIKIDSSQPNPYYSCKKFNKRLTGINACKINEKINKTKGKSRT